MQQDKKFSEKESLQLIAMMISKARDSYHETGFGAIMWGAVVAFCSLVKFSEIHFGFRLPFDIYLLVFVAIIPQVILSIKEKKRKKVKSYDDPYMDYIWLGFGICIALMILTINIMFNRWIPVANEYTALTGKKPAFAHYEFISPLFLILYGLPTFITGAACKFKPMLWGGLFCWGCCVITLFTTIKIDLLLTAASALMAWFIPGIIMEKEYRQYKKEQALPHV